MAVALEQVIELVKQTKSLIDNREMAGRVKAKGLADYVTQVDTGVQKFLSERLRAIAPGIDFLGEEDGLHEMKSDTFWILDPVDGTTNLIHDYKHSAVSLGLYSKGEIVAGVIYEPFRDEVFYAEKGKGAFMNGQPIHVSDAESLSECLITCGIAPYYKELAGIGFDRMRRIYGRCQDVRRTGSAAIDFAYTACGRVGGYYEDKLQPWDFAAGSIIVTEAGGKVTDFEGKPLDLLKQGHVLATNGKLHEELMSLL